ncbi:DgyrCDS5323 [Dimorphilus gyrociliatus]|uniref:DgyrCDS5323 n=1 Tax=Dimorphilus gyrociliatus TaxID=2664684 RepID=A0A7I8VK84_9ANNE|nr:DgyrCDS5323 [Dimorphilus gyrociliatus]
MNGSAKEADVQSGTKTKHRIKLPNLKDFLPKFLRRKRKSRDALNEATPSTSKNDRLNRSTGALHLLDDDIPVKRESTLLANKRHSKSVECLLSSKGMEIPNGLDLKGEHQNELFQKITKRFPSKKEEREEKCEYVVNPHIKKRQSSTEVEKEISMEDKGVTPVFTEFDPDKTPSWSCSLDDLDKVKPLANEGHKHRLKIRPKVRPPTQLANRKAKSKKAPLPPDSPSKGLEKEVTKIRIPSGEKSPKVPRTPPPKPLSLIKENSSKSKDISGIEKSNEVEKKGDVAKKTEENAKTPPTRKSETLANSTSPAKKTPESPTPLLRASRRSRNNSGSGNEGIHSPKPITSVSENMVPVPKPRAMPKEPSPIPKPRLSKEFKEPRASLGESSSLPLPSKHVETVQKLSSNEKPFELASTKVCDIKRSHTTKTTRVSPEADKSKRRSVDIEVLAANEKQNSSSETVNRAIEEKNKKINIDKGTDKERISLVDKNVAANKENLSKILSRNSSVVEKVDPENCSKIAEELLSGEKEMKTTETEPVVLRRTLSVGKETAKGQTEGGKRQPDWIAEAKKRASTWKDPDDNSPISGEFEEIEEKKPAASPRSPSTAKKANTLPTPKADNAVAETTADEKTLTNKPVFRKSDGIQLNEDKKPIINKPKPVFVPKEIRADVFSKGSSEVDLVKPSDLKKVTTKTSQNSSTNTQSDSPAADKANKENKPKESSTPPQEDLKTTDTKGSKPRSTVSNLTKLWESGVR